MSTNRDIDSIFLAAAALPAEERAAYVAEACGDDHELSTRVNRLLASKSVASDFLESPAEELVATADSPSCEKAGDTVGRFKLLQKIGEGGMGTVFMAEQVRPVSRRVALKIIKPGMDSKAVIARFEAERQALAMMDHPNIAKVLDAGTTGSGRPYFVMELVKGLSVTAYCDENKLSVHERLQLFIQICQAIQHAHQKGIIHRDLKPTNVLVAKYDDEAVPKIIDFGVAKAISQRLTEKTMFTEFGQIVGTLEYMSPEQAQLNQLDVDTRSDIYSLGVLLYELLTGETPFDGKRLRSSAFDEVLRILREEEPPRPSNRISTLGDKAITVSSSRACDIGKLGGFLRGDIDLIVMKSMEKDRSRRYDSASALASDIQRYLSNDAILARPPSVAYRIRKLWARNRLALSTAAIVLLAVAIGLGSVAWSLSRQQLAFDTLRGQLTERAFEYALIGDLKSFDEAMTGAKTARVTKDWLLTLEAVADLHQGQNEKAHRLFTQALSINPHNTTAWAMKSIAIKHLGDELEWEEHMSALKEYAPRDQSVEMDSLSLAYAKWYVNFRECAEELETILQHKKTWFVAHAMKAGAIAEEAHSTAKPDLMEDAIEQLRVPFVVAQDNPLVNLISLFIHKVRLISFGEVSDPDWLSEEIESIAARAEQQQDYDLAQMILAEYYSASGQSQKSIETWYRLLDSRGFLASVAIAECCRSGDYKQIRRTQPRDPEALIAKACALATSDDPADRDFAYETFEQLVDEQTSAYIRLKLLQLVFLLRDDALIAKNRSWEIIETNRDNMYGDIRQKILVDFAGKNVALDERSSQPDEKLLVNYYRALQSYAVGDLPKAIEYITVAINAKVGSVEWYWARALKERWTATSSDA